FRSRERAHPRPFGVSDRRCVSFAPLRLRRAAGAHPRTDSVRGARCTSLHGAGRTGDRPPQQAASLRAAGGWPRHGRGESRARLRARHARLWNRQPDPRRPRPDDRPHPHEQPEEDHRDRGLRRRGRGTGADRDGADPRERTLPRDETRQARPQAAPPGPQVRGRRRMSDRWPGDEAEALELDEEAEPEVDEPEDDEAANDAVEPESEPEEDESLPRLRAPGEHAEGELDVPDDVNLIEGEPDGTRRGVAIVAARFNGEITNRLLDSA